MAARRKRCRSRRTFRVSHVLTKARCRPLQLIVMGRFSYPLLSKIAIFSLAKDIPPDSWLSLHALGVPSGHWYSKPQRRTKRNYRCPQRTDPPRISVPLTRDLQERRHFSPPKISGSLHGFRFTVLAAASGHSRSKPQSLVQRSSLTYHDQRCLHDCSCLPLKLIVTGRFLLPTPVKETRHSNMTSDLRPDSWLSLHALDVPSWHCCSKPPTLHKRS